MKKTPILMLTISAALTVGTMHTRAAWPVSDGAMQTLTLQHSLEEIAKLSESVKKVMLTSFWLVGE